jgi:hypothetical protein
VARLGLRSQRLAGDPGFLVRAMRRRSSEIGVCGCEVAATDEAEARDAVGVGDLGERAL